MGFGSLSLWVSLFSFDVSILSERKERGRGEERREKKKKNRGEEACGNQGEWSEVGVDLLLL